MLDEDARLMFFDDVDIAPKKRVTLRLPPPIPHTGWTPPSEFPNLSAATCIAFDTETKDIDLVDMGPGWARKRGHIVGVSIAAEDRLGNTGKWYFPVRHEVQPEFNMNPDNVFGFLKPVLEDRRTAKIGANLMYDIGWLTEENIFVDGPLLDVQFAEALVCEDLVALDILGRKYLGIGKTTNMLYEWLERAYPETSDRQRRADIFRAPPSLVGP
jgi:DNA polymerase I-like protein with 3'-5' exonuclease and polymerase domains